MDTLILNRVLNRESISREIESILQSFDTRVHDVSFKKGIYIYGSPGSGKTQFVLDLLKRLNYDVVKYDAGDVRNKSLIDTITSNNVSRVNVLNMMKREKKRIAIVMDEIDGMNSGDKGGITSLIKLIRQKRTKKQKTENVTMNPIICISNYFVDKKIKELMKVCHVYELAAPTEPQIAEIVRSLMPRLGEMRVTEEIHEYIQRDLRKVAFIHNMYLKRPDVLTADNIRTIFGVKSYNDDSKLIVRKLFRTHVPIQEHNTFMNETDRTTVALLWHENVVDAIQRLDKRVSIPFYLRILDNICFADYVDRITFQNQIWIFNEMSSLMKTFHNNKLFHDLVDREKVRGIDEVRFTKVLTKYSTEYNNLLFVFALVQELDMDRKDMIAFFQELRLFFGTDFYNRTEKLVEVEKLFSDTNITKLDIRRVYRYLDKTVKRDSVASAIEDEYEVMSVDEDCA